MLCNNGVCLTSYAEQSGRESVLEFLVIVFKKFPEVHLNAGLRGVKWHVQRRRVIKVLIGERERLYW